MNPLLLALLSLAAPQGADQDGFVPPTDQAFETWREAFGPEWRLRKDRGTGYAELVFGWHAESPFVPAEGEDWFNLTQLWASESFSLLGVHPFELVPDRQALLPLGMHGGTDKVSVQLRQQLGGVPVEGGFLNALYTPQGALLSLANTTIPGLAEASSTPALEAAAARARARRFFVAETRLEPTFLSEPELLFARLSGEGPTTARLAWKVTALHKADGADPVGATYFVDAGDGSWLRRDEAIHYALDVTGRVDARATGGSGSNDTVPTENPIPVPYLTLTSSAGDVVTDRDGNFTIVGANAPVNITATFQGPYCDTNNDQGADYSITFTGVQPGQANVLEMNSSPSEFVTAQANSQIHHGVVRQFILDTAPGDTTGDFLAVSNTNLASTCNAYFDGFSTNYFAAGGGCSNTAFSNVVAHELGHWLNVRYNTGNGGDGMGEGNADVWAMYTYDTPVIGEGFFAGTGQIRNGTNTRQYCGDGNGGCYGAVHTDGEVWMGAAWKVRTNLKNSLGAVLGGQTANGLFMGWMNGFNQTAIDSIIEIQWLTLDDNDGSIGNGTPNYAAIDGGFRQQGFPGYDLPFVQISSVTDLPDVSDNVGPYTVSADVVAGINPPLAAATLHFRVGSGGFVQVPMQNIGGDTHEANIPNFQGAAVVSYFVSGTDSAGQSASFPDAGAASPLSFSVGTPVVVADHDFESGAQGWFVSTPNNATTGIWERGDPIGTAAQPENDTSVPGVNCWFTGQGSAGGTLGENDVDGGTTTLESPDFDLSTGVGHQIRYMRWYSNQTGAAPQADTLLIDLSNNGGATWVTVDSVGPTGAEAQGGWIEHVVDVAAHVTPTATVRMRVRASDLGSGSIVEAALDDVRVSYLEDPTNCPGPTTYCGTSANSYSSTGAFLSPIGSASITDNNFGLVVSNAVPGQFGLVFYGNSQVTVPSGAGVRCVGGNL
ncbi:MAG: hypothetical protein O2799_10100, partial [Planctomycetota bacterium]|nr:hypothetical protein [Planctomycetota bacterium]